MKIILTAPVFSREKKKLNKNLFEEIHHPNRAKKKCELINYYKAYYHYCLFLSACCLHA